MAWLGWVLGCWTGAIPELPPEAEVPEDPDANVPVDDTGVDPVTLDDLPPVVVRTVPEVGAEGVKAGPGEIEVEFSRPMDPTRGCWWFDAGGTISGSSLKNTFPSDTVAVTELEFVADTAFVAWVNGPEFPRQVACFRAAGGRPPLTALAYPIAFATGPSTLVDPFDGQPGVVVHTEPVAGLETVDPSTARITIGFSVDVGAGDVVLSDEPPGRALGITGVTSLDSRTIEAEVALTPETVHAVRIEADDIDGVPVAPYVLAFRTAP